VPAPGHTSVKWSITGNAVTSQRIKSVSCPLVIVFLGMQCPATRAEIYDITELQQPDTTSPAMAGFYNVTPDGETAAEDPLESGFATSAGSDFDPERSPQEEPDANASGDDAETTLHGDRKKRKTRTVRIRVKRKPPERDLAAQFQCERHGFYYTNDGRCVAPAYGHLPLSPQPLPGRDMKPTGKINGNMMQLDR
jgi:hypothetical protein